MKKTLLFLILWAPELGWTFSGPKSNAPFYPDRPDSNLFLAPNLQKALLLEKKKVDLQSFERWQSVDHLRIQAFLELQKEQSEFTGEMSLFFQWKAKNSEGHWTFPDPKGLKIDFKEGKLLEVKLNGQSWLGTPLSPEAFFYLPIEFLKQSLCASENHLEMRFSAPYTTQKNGIGLLKSYFDEKEYLWLTPHPDSIASIFPLFNQPDLRARVQLNIMAPNGWKVFSFSEPKKISSLADGQLWTFEELDHPLALRRLPLVVGPWEEMRGKNNQNKNIKAYAPENFALNQNFPLEAWLELTEQAIETYQIQFGVSAPSETLSQFFFGPTFYSLELLPQGQGVLSFSLNEIYRLPFLFGSKWHINNALSPEFLLFRQIAQQWIGSLISPKGEMNLWIFESLASAFALYAMELNAGNASFWDVQRMEEYFFQTHFWLSQTPEALHLLYPSLFKPMAEPHSHPGLAISEPSDLKEVGGILAFEQLFYLMGEAEFKDALQRLLARSPYSSVSLVELLQFFSEASSREWWSWLRDWLVFPGVDQIEARWSCSEGPLWNGVALSTISQFNLHKTPITGFSNLREHRILIYSEMDEIPKSERKFLNTQGIMVPKPIPSFEVSMTARETSVKELKGQACPKFVFPNEGDQETVFVALDQISLEYVKTNWNQIKDPAAKVQILRNLVWKVLQAQVSPSSFFEWSQKILAEEQDLYLLSNLHRNLIQLHMERPSLIDWIPEKTRAQKLSELEKLFLTKIKSVSKITKNSRGEKVTSPEWVFWSNALAGIAKSQESLELLRSALIESASSKSFHLSPLEKSNLLLAFARLKPQNHFFQELQEGALKQKILEVHPIALFGARLDLNLPEQESKNFWMSMFLAPLLNQAFPLGQREFAIPVPSLVSILSDAQVSPYALLEELSHEFQVIGQQELTQFANPIAFDTLEKYSQKSGNSTPLHYAIRMAQAILSETCSQENLKSLQQGLEKHAGLLPILKDEVQAKIRRVTACLKSKSQFERASSSL